MRVKVCKKCGKTFDGSAHAWYCDACKREVLREQKIKDVSRIKQKKIEGTCIICGRKFFSYFNKNTCGEECELKLKSMRKIGHQIADNTKDKIGDKNCIRWHLVSPEGKHYKFRNLVKWSQENCELFGFEKNNKNAIKIMSGISQAKGAMLGRNSSVTLTYKGWRVML